MELKDKIINFLGDSITQGVGVENPENIFHQKIAKKYGLKSANNYGISGTRIAKQKNPTIDEPSFDKWFCSRVDEMTPDADAVVVFGGTNDWGHGDAPIGKFSDRTDDTFYGACHVLFSSLIIKYAGKPIVVLTPLHRYRPDEDELDIKDNSKATLKDYVDIIREVAEYYSLPVCDLFANSGLQPKVDVIRDKFVPDGLHPNDDGHAIMAERVGNFLLGL